VVVVAIAGRLAKHGIFASTTWVAYAGDVVPEKVAKAFDVVALARDEALALIGDRTKRRRAVKGTEVDQAARGFISKAGFGEQFVHRTGHSIDSDLQGAAADFDDYEVKDVRNLVRGTGYAIAPGVYFDGEFGVRAEVCLFLGTGGVEVTTPAQDQVEPLLSAK
jgi:Xaa-Pro aminopeptidase